MRRTLILLAAACLAGLALSLGFSTPTPVSAQGPSTWQDGATGLASYQNEEQKTAGLGIVVQAQDWPFLSLRGGVEDSGSWEATRLAGPIGIELGKIRVPGRSGTFSDETGDWAHNEMTFAYGGGSELKLWVSRLSPAVLLQSPSDSLALLTGSVSGNVFDGSIVSGRPDGPSHPKYVAYPTSGGVRVRRLGTSPLSLPSLSQNWLLLWYGDNSHFVDTKVPLSYKWTVLHQDAYQADAPMLLVFQNQPSSIGHSAAGGVDLSFAGSAGRAAILPLYGRDNPRANDTETWSEQLPTDVRQKAQWWAEHLCSYPETVRETYAYEAGSDTAVITERVSFLNVCSGGTLFAPIPPVLGMVKDTMDVHFSGTVVDGGLDTEFGPVLGIEVGSPGTELEFAL